MARPSMFQLFEIPARLSIYPEKTDPIPSLEALLTLEEELKALRHDARLRSQKADDDINVLDSIMARAPPRDAAQDTQTNRVEKESRVIVVKPRAPSLHISPDKDALSKDSSVTPRSAVPPRKAGPKVTNKNKRKRVESDEEDFQPDGRSPVSPPPSYAKQKHLLHVAPSKVPRIQRDMADDAYWTHPQRKPTVPQPPRPQTPPIPGFMRQADVDIDLSQAKPPASQIAAETFWKTIEPWIRDLGDDDVAAMSYIDDDPEPFVVPPLGKHYLDRWADEDAGLYPSSSKQTSLFSKSFAFRPSANFDPTDLTEGDWHSEEKTLGPIAERVVTALQPKKPDEMPGLPTAIADELVLDDNLASTGPVGDIRVNAEELDVRIKRQLKELGLWTEQDPDYSAPEDDSILAELRQCQRLLKEQMALNAARKARLLKRCEDRLAYQDYAHQLERLDEQILTEYRALTKKSSDKHKSKKGKDKVAANGHPISKIAKKESGEHTGPDDPGKGEDRVVMSESIMKAVRLRQSLVDLLGPEFERLEQETPGGFFGLPEKSIYDGVTLEEGRSVLSKVNPNHPALA